MKKWTRKIWERKKILLKKRSNLNLNKWKLMRAFQNVISNLKIFKKLNLIWTVITKWQRKPKLKTQLQIVHIIWQNYSSKKVRNKRLSHIISHILKQLNLKNLIKRIESWLIKRELLLQLQRQIKIWINISQCWENRIA